jgi:hypothetical protein
MVFAVKGFLKCRPVAFENALYSIVIEVKHTLNHFVPWTNGRKK